ncbi:MAG: hypothetical protein MUE81_13790, partial [Thermoflexibacter sp.]|nr:hypothetical protein [Thermoflexibacter sp.]
MKNLLFIVILLLYLEASAQQLLPPINHFSYKKESYLIKSNGDTVKFFFVGMRYKNKQKAIISVIGKDAEGKKTEYMAEDIKIVAMPPSDLGKWGAFGDANKSIDKSKKTNQHSYNREMIYFFSENVEGINMLLQMLNPDFSTKIIIYHDVYAKETMGAGIGGITLAGREDKSYYIKVNGETSKIQKKEYKEKFAQLFGKC